MFLLVFGTNLLGVILSIRGHERGGSMLVIGLYSAAWSGGFIVSAIACGSLLSRLGHRHAFLALTLLSILLAILFPLLPRDGRGLPCATLLQQAQATAAKLRRLTIMQTRLERARTRDDTRQWVQDRRARTRQLIELGGLVQKARLVELLQDDRATLLGALLEIGDQLQGHEEEDTQHLKARWRHRGMRVFDLAHCNAPALS